MLKKLISTLLAFYLFAIPWSGQAQESGDRSLKEPIDQWLQQLAKNDQRFTAFTTAEQHQQPLGTDNSEQLLIIGKPEQPIGYLILRKEGSTRTIVEYGLGPTPLFEQRPFVPLPTKSRSKHIPLYAGLQSVWVIDAELYDAKSGEKYPVRSLPTFESTEAIHEGDSLLTMHTDPRAEQIEPWINPEIEIKTDAELIEFISKNKPLSYVAHLFENHVLAPFSVQGYHKWNDTLFIELEDEGSRFIPVQHARQLGTFYQ